MQLASVNGESRFQLMAGSHPVSLQGLDHGKKLGVVITTPKAHGQSTQHDRPSSVVARFEQQAAQGAERVIEQFSSPVDAQAEPLTAEKAKLGGSQAALQHRTQTTIPQPMTAIQGSGVDVPLGTLNMRSPSIPSGLGLMLQGRPGIGGVFEQSPTPTVPDDPFEMAKLLHLSRSEGLPLAFTPSIDGRLHGESPNRDFVQRALNSRNAAVVPPLEVPLDLPTAQNRFNETPAEYRDVSSKATPDLSEIQQYLNETRDLIEAVSQSRSVPRSVAGASDGAANDVQFPAIAEEIGELDPSIASSVPVALQSSLHRLVPAMNGILDHLKMYPNFSTSLQHLSQRVEQLQNASFDHVAPEEFQNKFDHFEGRVLELETRVDKHDEMQTSIEADLEGLRGRRGQAVGAGASFESNASARSATSSVMIQAAMDKLETEEKLKHIQGRVELLETIASPSFSTPWEIEIVLLPWGRQLKGIWMAAEDDNTQNIASVLGTQNSDEWTQARSRKSVSVDPAASFSSARGGWSHQAIYEWADAADEWLLPRACGPSGIVFKRLQSRGFVRKIILTNSGARHVLSTVTAAFRSIIEQLEDPTFDPDEEVSIASSDDKVPAKTFLGLREAFIPLRKVRRSSRLKFLAPSELLTPALWDARFLNSDVLMHAPGGCKRLFITSRAAYLQCQRQESVGWTWQKLRELPRVTGDDTLDAVHPQPVGEADARESCWAYHATLDPPPNSANSSFGSRFADESIHEDPVLDHDLSHKPQGRSVQSQPIFQHPITPLTTEFPEGRHRFGHSRTASGPHTASAPSPALGSSMQRDPQQRRVASFDQPNTASGIRTRLAPRRHTLEPRMIEFDRNISRAAIHRVSESPPKTRQVKRRRIVQSSSSQSGDDEEEEEEEPLDVLLRVAQGGSPTRRGRQSSSEPLDVLLRVAEGSASLSDAERRVLGSAIEKQRRRRRHRDDDLDMADDSEEDEYMPSGQEGDGSDEYESEDVEDAAPGHGQQSQATSAAQLSRLSEQFHFSFMPIPTPRLSREPTSPFVSTLDGPPLLRTVSGGNLSVSGLRPASTGTTSTNHAGATEGPAVPYATPFSAAGGFLNSCGGDTQVDSVSLNERLGAGDEDVWEGWEEGDGKRPGALDGDEEMEDDEDDNASLDGQEVGHGAVEDDGA